MQGKKNIITSTYNYLGTFIFRKTIINICNCDYILHEECDESNP